jgi:hypothetical protein
LSSLNASTAASVKLVLQHRHEGAALVDDSRRRSLEDELRDQRVRGELLEFH